MKMSMKFLLLIMFISISVTYSQQHGLFQEFAMFQTNASIESKNVFTGITTKNTEARTTKGMIVGYFFKANLVDDLYIAMKPGLLLGNIYILGADLKLLMTYNITNDFFVSGGMHVHQNMGTDQGGLSHSESSITKAYILYGISGSFMLSKKFAITGGYFLANYKSWKRYTQDAFTTEIESKTDEKLGNMLNIGLDYFF